MMLKAKAYAKINLSLDIVGVRADGYHLIKTVMQSISLHDVVSVCKTGTEIVVTCDDLSVPCDSRNIVYRCAERFFERIKDRFGVHIDIQKHIPSQAGLGGGSADGAAVLVMLNELCGNPLTTEHLCKVGAKVGADIPFCIIGGSALCEGIGDIITPIDSKLGLDLCIAKPSFGISTAEAYKRFDTLGASGGRNTDAVIGALKSCDKKLLAENLFNVLEFDPRIDEFKQILLNSGAIASCMSGSGSAVFAIVDGAFNPPELCGARTFSAVTCNSGVELIDSEGKL